MVSFWTPELEEDWERIPEELRWRFGPTRDGCLVWVGPRDRGGYGIHRGQRTHRLVLASLLGRPIGPGLLALHSCDNRPCGRPGHLREGTTQDNSRDAVRRDRLRRIRTPRPLPPTSQAARRERIRALAKEKRFST